MKVTARSVGLPTFSMGNRRHLVLAVTAALIFVLAFASARAWAGTAATRPLLYSFDGSATPNGAFGSPQGMAFDQADSSLYLLDRPFNVLHKLDTAGAPQNYPSLGFPMLDGSATPEGSLSLDDQKGVDVAVDQTGGVNDGNIYIANGGENYRSSTAPNALFIFDSSGEFLFRVKETALGSLEFPCGVAVDSNGDLYVADGGLNASGYGRAEGRIYKFHVSETSLTLLSVITRTGRPGSPCGLAIDSNDNLYVNSIHGFGLGGNVEKYDSSGQFESVVDPGPATAIAVDPSNDRLFVDHGADGGSTIVEYNAAGSPLAEFGAGFIGNSRGVEVEASSDHVLVSDTSTHNVHIFGTPASVTVPDVSIGSPSALSYFDATLAGTLNPQGVPTTYHFEYRAKGALTWTKTEKQDAGSSPGSLGVAASIAGLRHDTSYQARLVAINTDAGAPIRSGIRSFTTETVPPPTIAPPTDISATGAHFEGTVNPRGIDTSWQFEYSTDGTNWEALSSESAGSGSSGVSVSADVSELEPNVQYHVRLAASNAGSDTVSEQETFKTIAIAPQATTREPYPVYDTSARLRGVVDANNASTIYRFEYGLDVSYGTTVPIPDADAGAAGEPIAVGLLIEGLQPATTYHYRIVVENAAGTAEGDDAVFVTRDETTASVFPDRRLELVTPPDKGQQIPSSVALAPQGDHVLWTTRTGAPGSPIGSGGQFASDRTPTGWKTRSLIPPVEETAGEGGFKYKLVQTSSDTQSALYVASEGIRGKSYIVRVNPDLSQDLLFTHPIWPPPPGRAASADLKHVYVTTEMPINPEHQSGATQIYDVGDGTPNLVSRLPDNSVPTCGIWTLQIHAGFETERDSYRWTSSGSKSDERVFFETQGSQSCGNPFEAGATPSHVYRRDLATDTTIALAGQPVSGAEMGDHFIRSSLDGSHAIFTTKTNLDPDGDDTDPIDLNPRTSMGMDVYEWREGKGVQCLTCAAPVEANVLGDAAAGARSVVVAASLDRVYFVSSNQLVPSQGGPSGSDYYLYLWHDGQIKFVSRIDGNDGRIAPSISFVDGSTDITLTGDVMVFKSSLKGITTDSPGICTDQPDELKANCSQYYRYEDATGQVECLTCPRVGAEYIQPQFDGTDTRGAVTTESEITGTRYFPASSLTADGNTFVFTSLRPFVPEDVNRNRDLYEWHDGSYRLITDGVTAYDDVRADPTGVTTGPVIVGISPDGKDLVFKLAAQLTGHEIENTPQVFDARIDGGFSPPPSAPAPCVEDSCQGPLTSAPLLQAPGSLTLHGAANRVEKKAKKHRKRKHRRNRGHRKSQHGKRSHRSARG